MRAQDLSIGVEPDLTVQAFAQWLTELRARSSRSLQEMLSEMSIVRDGITANNVELTDFKRHSTSISQQMQSQLTDLREKLTNAFGEITSLVKQKTQSDQEMMGDVNVLQQNLSSKTAELEALKRSYSQAHQQLQSALIQLQNQLHVTSGEVQAAKATCDRVYRDTAQRFVEIDRGLQGLEDQLTAGNAESQNQMLQLREEIARIGESMASVNADFVDHKRAVNSVHNRLQSQVWGLEEGRKRQAQQAELQGASPASSMGPYMMHPSGGSIAAAQRYPAGGAPPANAGASGAVPGVPSSPRRTTSLPQALVMPGAFMPSGHSSLQLGTAAALTAVPHAGSMLPSRPPPTATPVQYRHAGM